MARYWSRGAQARLGNRSVAAVTELPTQGSMNFSHLVVCGLLVALLNSRAEAKPLTAAQQKSLRSLLGEELSALLGSGEQDAAGTRLLRDLRISARARGMWSRLLSDQPPPRKQKPSSKKGCFGHKMDRIGTVSGMGC